MASSITAMPSLFTTSEAMPLNDHRDRRRDWDVLSPS